MKTLKLSLIPSAISKHKEILVIDFIATLFVLFSLVVLMLCESIDKEHINFVYISLQLITMFVLCILIFYLVKRLKLLTSINPSDL